jgi:hypothetical protein
VTHIKVVHFEAVNPERNGFGVEDCSETLAGNAALRFRASDGAADVAIVGIEGGAVRHQVAETVDKNVGEMLASALLCASAIQGKEGGIQVLASLAPSSQTVGFILE